MANNFSNYYHFSQAPTVQWSQQYQYPVSQPTESSPITVSPTTSHSGNSDSEPILVSANVKIICPNEKLSEHRVFKLRDLDVSALTSMDSLRA